MKIGLVCPYNITIGGGVQECILALQKELTVRGHDVKIITPQPRAHDGVVANHIILIGGSASSSMFFNTQGIISINTDSEALQEMLDKENFDIIHFHEPWNPFLSRQILAKSNSVNVATFHAKLPDTVVSKTLEKVIIPYAKTIQKNINAISAVSPAAADFVGTVTPRSKITIIPNGIDLEKYRPGQIQKKNDGKTILFIGRLEKRKGVKYLLKAFKQFAKADNGVQLLLAGDGPDREKLEEWVKLHDVPRVKFLGYVNEKTKLKLLNEADLFCSPALFGESFGIVLLEAMAMGVVTVAGNNPGYTSVMKGRGRVSLVSPKDTPAFVHSLELLLNDKDIRKSWQDWAKTYVQQFDYKKVVGQYEDFYKKTLAQSKKERQ